MLTNASWSSGTFFFLPITGNDFPRKETMPKLFFVMQTWKSWPKKIFLPILVLSIHFHCITNQETSHSYRLLYQLTAICMYKLLWCLDELNIFLNYTYSIFRWTETIPELQTIRTWLWTKLLNQYCNNPQKPRVKKIRSFKSSKKWENFPHVVRGKVKKKKGQKLLQK